MNLPITQSILHGALRPSNMPDIAFQAIARKFNNLPSNLNDIEKLFISELGNYAVFDFEKAVAINNIAPDEYTSIKEYTIKPKIEIYKEEAIQTPQIIFYNAIINAEAARIKIALLNYSTVVQSNIDTRQELKETLRQIKSYIKKASKTADMHYQDLQANLIKLYYELAITFDILLTENDFTAFEDLYFECFNHYPSVEELNAYQIAKFIQEAQIQIALNSDIQEAQNLLLDICNSIKLNPDNSALFTIGIALENYVFLKQTNQAIPSYDQLINSDFVNLITKEQKSILRQRYESEEIAIDRANAIDDIFAELSFSNPLQSSLSITNNLLVFLNQQKDIYLKEPSAKFAPKESSLNTEEKLPSAASYAIQLATTKYTTFINEVAKYRFEELEMVKVLNDQQRNELIKLIVERQIAYSVPMLKHIGYFDYLKNTYGLTKTNTFKHIAKAIGSQERAIKGNFNVLKPDSQEDPYTYNSADFLKEVIADYKKITT